MNKVETIALMKIIKGYYPAYYQRGEAEEAVILWAKVLENEDFLWIQKGLERFVSTDRKGFPPVPGQIITIAEDMRQEESDRRKRERDLLPEPGLKGIPMPDELREKFNAMLDRMKV